MVAYTYRMPAGIPGEVTRANNAAVEPALMAATLYPTAFGVFVKMTAGAIQALQSGDAASTIYGLIVRPYPTGIQSSGQGLGQGVPEPGKTCNILRSGYLNVKLARGTAVRGAPVYLRITAGSYAVGDIEDATNVGAQVVIVPGATFMGSADANGNVEIAYNI